MPARKQSNKIHKKSTPQAKEVPVTGQDTGASPLDDQVARLREMLAIMAQSARTSAFGAGKPVAGLRTGSKPPSHSAPPSVESEPSSDDESPVSAAASSRSLR
jgi:hypothetical protein